MVSAEQIAADLGVEALVGSGGEGVWQPVVDPFAAVCGADAVLLLTEWQQFRQLDWPALAAVMRRRRASEHPPQALDLKPLKTRKPSAVV
jgi:UDPglucose 6-dehydrogenase